MTYEVYYWCPILPMNKTIYRNLSLKEAEDKVKYLNKMKQYDASKMSCCNYFLQPEG